ncbi:MAG: SDR family oxidoreductase [Halovenus sp.]
MQTALVTGVAGFIGSNLADELLERGHEVRGIDTFATGRRANLEPLRSDPAFSFSETDVRDAAPLGELLEGVDWVFHQAAVASVPRSVDDPVTTTDINCTGTATVVDCAREAGVESLVVASSSAVYGSGEELPKVETMDVSPESPYALSKYYTEQLAVQASDLYDLETVALRYFNVFGPRQDPQGEYAAVVPKFTELMLAGERPVIYGDGEQSRDFVFVDDVVEANILAAQSDVTGRVLNVARGERLTIDELVEHLNAVLGTAIEPTHDDPRPGDVRHSVADIGRARATLGYDPAVGFREGLRETVEWFE